MSRLERTRFLRQRRYTRSQQWMNTHREPLRRALAQITFDYLLAAHLLRYLLIRFYL